MFRVKNIILTASLGLMPLLSLAQTRLLIPDTLSGTSSRTLYSEIKASSTLDPALEQTRDKGLS